MSDYVDALVNKLMPDTQIAPLVAPKDDIAESEMQFAEQVGLKLAEAVSGETSATNPDRITDAVSSPFSVADIGRYVYVRAGAGMGMYRVVSYIDASNVTVENPDGSGVTFTTQTGLDYAIHDEPNLEHSMDYAITQLKEIVDPAGDWFQNMPRGFDPASTDVANAKSEKMSLKTLSDNWYGSKTKIIDIVAIASGLGNSDIGTLIPSTLAYGKDADRRGFVVQSSIGNDYYDEETLASIVIGKHKVTIADEATGNEFQDANGHLVFGVLQDGADHGGTGEGTDVFLKFVVDNAGVVENYTWVTGDPTDIIAYIPFRKKRAELNEYDERVFKVAGIVGDSELVQDITEIRSALGLADGDKAGDWDLTNTTTFFAFSELTLSTANMEDIVNILNSAIGSRSYTDQNVITNGETITLSLDKIDQFIGQGGYKSKILERLSANIPKGVVHTLPFAQGSNPAITSYKLDTAAHLGRFLEIWVAGNKIVPDSGASATDGEYEETSTTQVTFRFGVKKSQIVEYKIIVD